MQSPVARKRMSREKNIIMHSTTKNIMQHVLNKNLFVEKQQLNNMLVEHFNKHEGSELYNLIQNNDYNPKESKTKKYSIKKSKKLIDEIDTVPTADTIESIVKSYNISIPPSKGSLESKADFIKQQLKATLQKDTNDLVLIDAKKSKKEALVAKHEELRKECFNNWKSGYMELKSKISKSLAEKRKAEKASSEEVTTETGSFGKDFINMFNELTPLELKEVYDIKYQIDKLNYESVRLSRGNVVMSYLSELVLNTLVDAVYQQYLSSNQELLERNKHVVESRDKSLKKEKVRAAASIEDVSNLSFGDDTIDQIVKNLPVLQEIRTSKSLVKSEPDRSLISSVKNYVKETGYKFDKSGVNAVAAILENFIVILTELLPAQLKLAKIYTLKSDMFHNVIRPFYSFSGSDYSKLHDTIESLWVVKSAKKQ